MPPKNDSNKENYRKSEPPDKTKSQSQYIKPPKFTLQGPQKLSNERLNQFKDQKKNNDKSPLSKEAKPQQRKAEQKRKAEEAALHHPKNSSPPGKLSKNFSQNSMDLSNLGRESLLDDPTEVQQVLKDAQEISQDSNLNTNTASSSKPIVNHNFPGFKKKIGNESQSSVQFSENQNIVDDGLLHQRKGTEFEFLCKNYDLLYRPHATDSLQRGIENIRAAENDNHVANEHDQRPKPSGSRDGPNSHDQISNPTTEIPKIDGQNQVSNIPEISGGTVASEN